MKRIIPGVLFAVTLSGAASLIYQVVWARKLMATTTAMTKAQAIVLAVFMGGLGLGALLGGIYSRKIRNPLAAYAWAEIAAALFALGSLHWIDIPISPLWLRLVFISLYLGVITTLLGLSLPFLVRFLEGRSELRFINLIYALNTAGAVAGCLLAGYIMIEDWGLTRAILFGAALSVFSALLALLLSGQVPKSKKESTRESVEPVFLFIAFLIGAVGLGAEVVWTRLVSLIVLNTVYAYAQVLALVLIGISVGAYLVSRLSMLCSKRSLVFVLALTLLFLSVVPAWMVLLAKHSELSSVSTLWIAAILLPALLCISFVFPILISLTAVGQASRSFGMLYASNTLGGILGSLFVGFYLLPAFQIRGAVTALACLVLLGAVFLLSQIKFQKTAAIILSLALLTSGILWVSNDVPRQIYEARLPEGTQIREFKEGISSDVMVTDDENGRRRLWINSAWVAGTGGGHLILGHLPALFLEAPKQVLGIALGTGQTFASIRMHHPDQIDCVELNDGVIDLSRKWFSPFNGNLYDQPNVRVIHQDGRTFLRETQKRYDLIVLEPLQAWSAGTSNLYSKEFYQEARRVLSPHGVLAQWIPFYGQDTSLTQSMVKTALAVFPQGSLWLDDNDGILIVGNDPFQISEETLKTRIQDRKLEPMLRLKHLDQTIDFLSLYLTGTQGLVAWSKNADVLEDDRPFLEYQAARTIGRNMFQSILSSLKGNLENFQVAHSSIAIRKALLDVRLLSDRDFEKKVLLLEPALREIPTSNLLRKQYHDAILAWADDAEKAGAGLPQIESIYRRGIKADPNFGEAKVNLAIAYAQRGDLQRARRLLLEAQKIDRTKERADKILVGIANLK